MLGKIDLKKKLKKETFVKTLDKKQQQLFDLFKACWDQKISTVVVFEGWDAAGKGDAISVLTERLDPRGYKLYPIQAARCGETERHWLYRFWLKVPRQGQLVIFDRSWYGRVSDEVMEGEVSRKMCRAAYHEIAEFERMLFDDGTAIFKFFLHISAKEQRKRFDKLEADPFSKWRVTRHDWAHHERYDEYRAVYDDMLKQTSTDFAPWTIVEATSHYFAQNKIMNTLIRALTKRLGDQVPIGPPSDGASLDEDDKADVDVRKTMTMTTYQAQADGEA